MGGICLLSTTGFAFGAGTATGFVSFGFGSIFSVVFAFTFYKSEGRTELSFHEENFSVVPSGPIDRGLGMFHGFKRGPTKKFLLELF